MEAPEIDSGIAIPRRLATPDGDVALSDLPQWILQRPGRVVFVRAEAGEGKTTYLSLAHAVLRESAVVLRWIAESELTMNEVFNVTETVRSTAESASLPAVVLAELQPTLDEPTRNVALATLREHKSRADDTVFLIAGRPAEVNYLADRLGGTEISTLAPIDETEVFDICDRIQRAASEVAKTRTTDWIADTFPNLLTFTALPQSDRAAYFLVPDQPLIVGFLRAVYGNDFVQCLVTEYRNYDAADQHAYLHVCLATMAGVKLPEPVLSALAPAARLDERSRMDPWLRTELDEHLARHAVVAQAVVEGSEDYSALEGCFQDWVDVSSRRPRAVSLMFDVISGITYMKPLARNGTGSKRRIRARLIQVLANDISLQHRIVAESATSPARLFSWARLLWVLTPITRNDESAALLQVVVDLYEAALDMPLERTFAERIEYHRDRALRDLAVASGIPESEDDLVDRLIRWRDFLRREWVDVEFYASFFDAARELAHELTVGRPAERDTEPLYQAYLAGILAALYLRSSGDAKRWSERAGASEDLFVKHLSYALPKRQIDVHRLHWERSRELGTNWHSGTVYAESLIESHAKGGMRDESLVDEAALVLTEVLRAAPGDYEAIYQLAQIAVKRPEHIPFVRGAIERFSLASRWGTALVLNAAALIEHAPDTRRQHLQQAVDAATKLDRWSPHMWQKLGKHWQQHHAELRRLGHDSPDSQAALQRARKRFGPAR